MLRDTHLRMLWTARIDYDASSGVNPHKHDNYYQLLIILSGKGQTTVNESNYSLTGGNIYLFNKGCRHAFYFTEPSITLDYKFRIFNKEIDRILEKNELVGACPTEEWEEFKKWYQLSQKMESSSNPYILYRMEAGFKSSLLSLLSHFDETQHTQLETANEQSSVFPFANSEHPIVKYVEKNYGNKITLSYLAKRFNYNAHYIIKIFQEEVEMPPIQYLQEVRLHQACYLLEYTKMPVTDIAQYVGMTPPYFSRLFREKEGMSPTMYREYVGEFVGKDIILTEDFTNNWRIVKHTNK